MSSTALLGFASVGGFLLLVLATRTPVIVALLLTPIIAGLAGGHGGELGAFAIEGIRTVAPVAALIMFAILYFGLMIDVGLFEPIIRRMIALVGRDPVRLCLVSAALPMFVALDGDGSTTFLISITALLPIHRRMGLNPLVLPAIVALAAGVMNILPWGGPVARAMSVLQADVDEIFLPVVPAMGAGLCWVFVAAWWLGLTERRRLAATAPDEVPPSETRVARPGRAQTLNVILTAVVILLLFQDLYPEWIALPSLPAPLLFMIAFAIALPANRRGLKAQQEQLASHAASVVLVTSMVMAAGVFTGVLMGTGMIKAMAEVIAGAFPPPLYPWLSHIVAVTSMPLSLVFAPDAYYFGVLPVFAETAAAIGRDPLAIGRAAVLGQMTTGFPLSPLTASTFVLLEMSQVTLRDHQRFVFKWAFGSTLVMTAVAWITGAL